MLSGLDDKPGRQKIAAQSLRVSEQAMSQRVRAALWQEEEAVHPLIVRLLTELNDLAEESELAGKGVDVARDDLRGTSTP